MISLKDIDLNCVSEHIAARTKRIHIRRVGLNEWKVWAGKGKKQRLVRFVKRAQWVVECSEFHGGEPCPANTFGNLCSHVYAVVRNLQIQQKRLATMERKAA